jgi:hypothetical protein
MNIFISGSISIAKLPQSATKKIDSIIDKDYTILIGDAKGVDLHVQKYIYKKKYDNVIIYFIGREIRNNVGNWKVKEINNINDNKRGRELYTLKDLAMAKDSDYGLMIWDGKSQGTLNNIEEMKKENKRFFVVLDGVIIDDTNIDSLIDIQNRQIEKLKSQPELF